MLFNPFIFPDWLGAALLAAVSALLGFLGQRIFDLIDNRRKRKQRAIETMANFKSLLDETKSVFENQGYLVNRLMTLLLGRYGSNLDKNMGYATVFYRFYDQMNEEELELFKLIRGITSNSMFRLNKNLLQWTNDFLPVHHFSKSTQNIKLLNTQLTMLRKHLNMWFDKYDALLKTDERHCLVYFDFQSDHGEAFPRELRTTVESVLWELGLRSWGTEPFVSSGSMSYPGIFYGIEEVEAKDENY